MALKIEYIPIDDLKTYENNAKIHTVEQIKQIKKSINEYGFNDPIAVWEGNVIIEGHGRLIAAKELGIKEVPVIRLDNLTDEQRREYALVHNQTTLNSGFDFSILDGELDGLPDFDAEFYGFEIDFNEAIEEPAEESENIYTSKVDVPQYEPSGENVSLVECLDKQKYRELVNEIEKSNVTEDEKEFLKLAAARHFVFSYKKIADYYASKANPEMQKLMEKSALVIIDYNDAIKNGYAILRKTVVDLMQEEGYET